MDKCFSLIAILLVSGQVSVGTLPDLIPDPLLTLVTTRIKHKLLSNMSCAMEEGCASSSAYAIEPNTTEWFQHRRVLLVFSTISWNFGSKPFFSPTDPDEWEWHQCHDHYHSMQEFAYYDILDSQGNLAAEGHKASYCLRDSTCLKGFFKNYNCEGKNDQGISVGCADYYSDETDCQWIDMTDVLPGNYTFQTHVNPQRSVPELNYNNNVMNCDLIFDGTSGEVTTCSLEGVVIGDLCEEDKDCSYPYSKCIDSQCGCKPGYRVYKVSRWATVCVADCDPMESLACENGGTKICPYCLECESPAQHECRCPKGFTGKHCEVSKGKRIGDSCRNTNDCKYDHARCVHSLCSCKAGYDVSPELTCTDGFKPEVSNTCLDCMCAIQSTLDVKNQEPGCKMGPWFTGKCDPPHPQVTGCVMDRQHCRCGPYLITEQQFLDCKELTELPFDDFHACAANSGCARQCLKAYMGEFALSCTGKQKAEEVTCKDFARMLYGGKEGCKKRKTQQFGNSVAKCAGEIE